MLNARRAKELIRRFADLRVLVAGDLMLDEFVWGNVARISPEAPVPVVEVTGESFYAGGAANVARNLREFTPGVSVAGLTGADAAGERLTGLLRDSGIDSTCILEDPARRTIVKTRVVARHQQVVRIDRESRLKPDERQTHDLLARLEDALGRCDALLLSDYAKGFLTPEVAQGLCRLAKGKIITVDPSPKNPLPWQGVTAVKPNLKEARAASGLGDEAEPEAAGTELLRRWGTEMVLLTMGEQGMLLFHQGEAVYHTPTRAREVFDVSGAGDTAIAVFTLGLAAGASPAEAAELANHASGVAVGKLGTATVNPRELEESVREIHGE